MVCCGRSAATFQQALMGLSRMRTPASWAPIVLARVGAQSCTRVHELSDPPLQSRSCGSRSCAVAVVWVAVVRVAGWFAAIRHGVGGCRVQRRAVRRRRGHFAEEAVGSRRTA